MGVVLSVAASNARLDALAGEIGDAAKILIYSGTRPDTPDDAVTDQVLLAELTGGTPFADPAEDGVLTANAITDDSAAAATGTATWFRIVNGDDDAVLDGSVGTSGADMIMNTTAIVTGGPVKITSLTIDDEAYKPLV